MVATNGINGESIGLCYIDSNNDTRITKKRRSALPLPNNGESNSKTGLSLRIDGGKKNRIIKKRKTKRRSKKICSIQ
jgi:hypothetical protein